MLTILSENSKNEMSNTYTHISIPGVDDHRICERFEHCVASPAKSQYKVDIRFFQDLIIR